VPQIRRLCNWTPVLAAETAGDSQAGEQSEPRGLSGLCCPRSRPRMHAAAVRPAQRPSSSSCNHAIVELPNVLEFDTIARNLGLLLQHHEKQAHWQDCIGVQGVL